MNDQQPSTVPLSRRERREQSRMGNRNQSDFDQTRRRTRRVLIWGSSMLLVVGFVWLMIKLAGTVQPSDDGVLSMPVSQTDHILGPADAPVTLVEYSDFQCPACASFHPLIQKALTEPELTGKVRFVYRHFPLSNIHPHAQLAAQAAEAAALQGKFWEMHDLLFKNQSKWSVMSAAGAREAFLSYASSIGLEKARYTTDVDSAAVKEKVSDNFKSGELSGINSTPSFFLNGTQMAHPNSYESFKQALIAGLNPSPSPSSSPNATP